MLAPTHITSSLLTHWRDTFPLPTPTLYPGTTLDTSAADEWIELWIDTWSRPPQRTTSPHFINLILTAHLFLKPTLTPARLHEVAEATRTTLAQQRIPLRDYTLSAHPLIGYATLLEPETRDLTRHHLNSNTHVHHLTLTIPGTAQSI